MLDAIEDWKLSSRESLTDLLFTEGQSRETYNVATSNVYANWENGVGNLVMEEPSGTSYRGPVSRHKGATTNSRENVLQYVRFPGDENGDEKGASTNSVGSQSGLPNSLPTPTAVTVMVDLPKFIIPPIRMTKEQYEQFVKGMENGDIALEEISLPVEGMHPKMIQFVGENRDLYLAFTRQYGFAYQHKLNALFKMGFDVHVGGRHVMNWASGNIEMTNIYVDTSTFFVPSYHETTAERMKDIIDFIATKHEGVKSPVLRAGDFAVWYNPNQTMIQSGSLVDTNVYNLATQVAEDAATELILEVSGTKLAALSGGAAMQGGGAALHGGAEAGSVGLAAIMWWFRNRRDANRVVTKAGEEIRSLVITGWRKGKGAPHFTKHGQGMGYASLKEYTEAAKALMTKTTNVIESKVGNLIFKYDKDTQRILIVSAKERTIVTYYKAADGLNSFKQAMRDHWDVIK